MPRAIIKNHNAACRHAMLQSISVLWTEYRTLYGKLEDVNAEISSLHDKRSARLKRKLSELQGEIGGELADAEKRCAKNAASTKKVPDVMKMLQQMM